MKTNLKFESGKVNDQSRLYTFSDFVPLSDFIFLLMHANEESRFWNERFGHLNSSYMHQIIKKGMIKEFLSIEI